MEQHENKPITITSKQQQKQIKTVMYHLSISTWKKIHYIKHDMTTQQLWITKINYTSNVRGSERVFLEGIKCQWVTY